MSDGSSEPAGLRTEQLSRSFGARRALDRVDMRLGLGESLAVFGPNGAGKTTLIRVLTLALRPSSGTFQVAGLDPRREERRIRSSIGVISHQSYLYDELTARQNLEFFSRLYGVPDPAARAETLLESVDLLHRAEDTVGSFSHGMRQRVSIARALVHDPSVVFLDEPFSGLDPRAARMLRGMLGRLREEKRTVLLVTHDLTQGLELCDRWMLLARGRVASEGKTADTDRDGLERIYFEHAATRSRSAARAGR